MKISRRLALPLAFLLASAAALGAQEAPIPIARASVSSIDAVNKLIADLGIPGMPPLKTSLEGSFPFLGEGSIDSTKPLGLVVLAGANQPLMNPSSLVFAVPVTEGKATVASITAAGGTAVAGSTDTVNSNGHILRRTAAYLFARPGDNAVGLSTLTDDLFNTDYKKDSGNLAVLSLHLKEFRTSAPNAYKQLMAWPAVAMNMPPAQFEPVATALEKIDRYTLALATDDKNIHLRAWTSPSPLGAKPAKQAARPTFPAGTIFQMHCIFPDAETAGALEGYVLNMIDQQKDMPADAKPAATAFVKRIAKIVSGSDVFSVGAAAKDKLFVVYFVSTQSGDYDVPAELKGLGDDAVALAKATNPTAKLTPTVSTYDAGGKTVQRLTIDDGTPEPAIVDVIQNGKTLYITLSPLADKMVGDLAALPPGPNSDLLCAGAIDLTAALNAASVGGGPLGMLKPDAVQELKTAFMNQGITWSIQISEKDNYMFSDVSIPTIVIKQLIKTISGAMGGM